MSSDESMEIKSANTFLDVADVHLFDEMMKTIPGVAELFEKNTGQSRVNPPAAEVKTLTPDPGFCVKTKCEQSQQKVFINICKSTEVALPPPKDISEEELTEILRSDEPSNYRVPMSLGEVHIETDKSGVPCAAYDVTVNAEFYQKVQNSELFKTFLISVSLEGLEDKYKIQLNNNDWVILKNRAYLGKMSDITVQKRPEPLITEIEKQDDVSESTDIKLRRSPRLIKETELMLAKRRPYIESVPHFTLQKLPTKLSVEETLTAEIQLPKVDWIDIALDVGEDRIMLEAVSYDRKNKYLMDIYIPCYVSPKLTSATYIANKELLLVNMPFDTTKN